ncbi:MAG: hypothetical protein JRE58_11980 [Deltaproteobacteria bacterium]|nr:hypothetical protein [Deltaproteobacteria bacterium]
MKYIYPDPDAFLKCQGDGIVQVSGYFNGGQPPQPVIGPQGQHQDIRFGLKKPFEAGKRPCSCGTADAAVGEIDPLMPFFLSMSWIRAG